MTLYRLYTGCFNVNGRKYFPSRGKLFCRPLYYIYLLPPFKKERNKRTQAFYKYIQNNYRGAMQEGPRQVHSWVRITVVRENSADNKKPALPLKWLRGTKPKRSLLTEGGANSHEYSKLAHHEGFSAASVVQITCYAPTAIQPPPHPSQWWLVNDMGSVLSTAHEVTYHRCLVNETKAALGVGFIPSVHSLI